MERTNSSRILGNGRDDPCSHEARIGEVPAVSSESAVRVCDEGDDAQFESSELLLPVLLFLLGEQNRALCLQPKSEKQTSKTSTAFSPLTEFQLMFLAFLRQNPPARSISDMCMSSAPPFEVSVLADCYSLIARRLPTRAR